MTNSVNRWLLRRLLYLLSVYFVVGSAKQPTSFTSMLYEFNYFIAQFELSFGTFLLVTTAQILLMAFVSVLIVVLGLYLVFKKTLRFWGRLGNRIAGFRPT